MRIPSRAREHTVTHRHRRLHAGASLCVPPDKVSGGTLTLTLPSPKTKVLIVYQACWIRRAMRRLVDESKRFIVCAETEDARNAIVLFEQHQPKIIVLGPVLTHGNALQLMKMLLKLAPAALVLVLSWEESPMSICRALRAGALGYLTVDDGDLELLVALDTIATGAYYVSKNLWSVVLKTFADSRLAQAKAGANLLTDRELEVFTLIGRGTGILEIAEELGVSIKTIETHQMRIKQKLNLANAAQLRKYAVHAVSKQRA